MAAQDPRPSEESLDIVELVMALEELLKANPSLTTGQRHHLMREIQARFERGEFNDEDDDTLAALVRNLGPRNPKGRAGAAVRPEESF